VVNSKGGPSLRSVRRTPQGASLTPAKNPGVRSAIGSGVRRIRGLPLPSPCGGARGLRGRPREARYARSAPAADRMASKAVASQVGLRSAVRARLYELRRLRLPNQNQGLSTRRVQLIAIVGGLAFGYCPIRRAKAGTRPTKLRQRGMLVPCPLELVLSNMSGTFGNAPRVLRSTRCRGGDCPPQAHRNIGISEIGYLRRNVHFAMIDLERCPP
jgi:hypothetical protein